MAEQYWHTLIATDHQFVPNGLQVQEFLQEMVNIGVVPEPITLLGMSPTGKTRTMTVGGDTFVHDIRARFEIKGLSNVAESIADRREFDVAIRGTGKPLLRPLPITFDGEYTTIVTCRVSDKLRSTSDPHWDFGQTPKAVPYGKPCPDESACGHFVNPHTGEEFEITNAGCSRFWIEFELGKFLFPAIQNGNLELLESAIVDHAMRMFLVSFAQGCRWC